MNSKEFSQARCFIGKTQNQLAQLLAISPKAIQSFEQGWRHIPPYVERQTLLLLTLKRSFHRNVEPCWDLTECPQEWRENCIVWEPKAGNFCRFTDGTFCQGHIQKSWSEKIQLCKRYEVYRSMLPASLVPKVPPL